MTATEVTNHTELALSRRLDLYKQADNLEWLLTAFCTQIQELETAIHDLITERWLDTAVGAQLDMLGEILDVDRLANTDEDYRIRLLAAVVRYKSSGYAEQLLSAFTLLAEADRVFLQEVFPAEVNITAVGGFVPVGSSAEVKSAMQDACAAGVSFNAVVIAGTNPFVFQGYPFPEGRGFGTVTDPSIGGVFASIL